MKRRVSRAHSNKHELRVISAANKLPLDRFHVVVDASFLRAILLSYWQEYESLYKSRPSAPDRQRGGPPIRAPLANTASTPQKRFVSAYQYLRDNVDEAFASSNVGGGSKMAAPRNAAHPKTTVFYYHVPETARTLRRLMAQPPASPTDAAQANGGGAAKQKQPQGGKGTAHKRAKVFDTTRIPEEVTGDLLSRLQRRGAEELGSTAGPRNEGKAVGELVLSGLRDNANGNGYYFVASQSHDVRRLLPSRTGILRWTRQPNGIWLEQNGKEGRGDAADGSTSLTSSLALSGGDGERRRNAGGSQAGPRLSTADMAFMRHIGRGDHLPRPSARPAAVEKAAEPASEADGADAKKPAPVAEATKPQPKRKRSHSSNPNPLSMKKKQKKEVFRIS